MAAPPAIFPPVILDGMLITILYVSITLGINSSTPSSAMYSYVFDNGTTILGRPLDPDPDPQRADVWQCKFNSDNTTALQNLDTGRILEIDFENVVNRNWLLSSYSGDPNDLPQTKVIGDRPGCCYNILFDPEQFPSRIPLLPIPRANAGNSSGLIFNGSTDGNPAAFLYLLAPPFTRFPPVSFSGNFPTPTPSPASTTVTSTISTVKAPTSTGFTPVSVSLNLPSTIPG